MSSVGDVLNASAVGFPPALALITEIKPAMLVRWLAAFHVVVDVHG
jgi:hypothetical protein